MITQDELELFIDGIIEPVYIAESPRGDDYCTIDFMGQNNDSK